ncbi:PepSY domain-containing protein, partial [Methylobacter tundripaludum]
MIEIAETVSAKNKSLRLTRLKKRRQLWLSIHLWLGLVLGFFLAIFGITGSILVFHAEIDELLNPTPLTVAQPAGNPSYKPLPDIF